MEFIINEKDSGMNIKDFIKREVNPSRKLLSQTKNKPDGILVNGEHVTVRYILKAGDVLNFNYINYAGIHDAPEANADLLELVDIIYEDEYILCVNKPSDMPSHPSFNHLNDTLANAVAAYYNKQNKMIRFHPVNRLDRNTSGLVLIAKDRLISPKLNALIKNGAIKKVYTAIVLGDFNSIVTRHSALDAESHEIAGQARNDLVAGILEYNNASKTGRITAPIKRDPDSIIKRMCADDGDYALTDFKFIKSNGEISLLEVYPLTGRTHQIRVHFHALGFALLGDDLYYDCPEIAEKYNIKRHALHAVSLEFEHPASKSNIKIACDLPEDMRSIIKIL